MGAERPAGRHSTGRAAAHALVGSGLALLVAGLLALVTGLPWLFPSLGPTALAHAEQPRSPSSCPRDTVEGHAVGAAAGWLSLAALGLLHAPSVLQAGVGWHRAGAAALSVAVTGAVLVLVRRPHTPAAATTLVVSLGLLTSGRDLLVLLASVVAVTVVTTAHARLSGVAAPLWGPAGSAPGS